jgi:hypothetical protein
MCAADTGRTPLTLSSIRAAWKRRVSRILTPRPVASATFVRHTERKQNGDGCKDGLTLESPPCPRNIGTRTTDILTRDRLRARALLQNNRDLQAVEKYVRLHQVMIRGRCSNA